MCGLDLSYICIDTASNRDFKAVLDSNDDVTSADFKGLEASSEIQWGSIKGEKSVGKLVGRESGKLFKYSKYKESNSF